MTIKILSRWRSNTALGAEPGKDETGVLPELKGCNSHSGYAQPLHSSSAQDPAIQTRSETTPARSKQRPRAIALAQGNKRFPPRHGSTSSVASTSYSSSVLSLHDHDASAPSPALSTSSSSGASGVVGPLSPQAGRQHRPPKLSWAAIDAGSTLPTSPLGFATTPASATSFGGYATPYDDGEAEERLADENDVVVDQSASSRRSSSSMSRTVTGVDKFTPRQRRPSVTSIASSIDSTSRRNEGLLRKAGRKLGLKASQSFVRPDVGEVEGMTAAAPDDGPTPSASRPASSAGFGVPGAWNAVSTMSVNHLQATRAPKPPGVNTSPSLASGLPSPMNAVHPGEPMPVMAAGDPPSRRWLFARSSRPKSSRPITADSSSSRSPRSPVAGFAASCGHASSSIKSTSIADVVRQLSPPPVGLPVLDFIERVDLVCRAANESLLPGDTSKEACKACKLGGRTRRGNASLLPARETMEQQLVAIELLAQKEVWLILANQGSRKDVIESLHLPRVFSQARQRLGLDASTSQFEVFASSSIPQPRYLESAAIAPGSNSEQPAQPHTAHPGSITQHAFNVARHGPSMPDGTVSLTPAPRKRRPRTAPEHAPRALQTPAPDHAFQYKIAPERLAALPKVKLTKEQLSLLRARAQHSTATLPAPPALQHSPAGAASTARSHQERPAAHDSRPALAPESPRSVPLPAGLLTPANFSRQTTRMQNTEVVASAASPTRVSMDVAENSDASSVHSNSSDSLRHVTAPRRYHFPGHGGRTHAVAAAIPSSSSPRVKSESLRESVETVRTEETASSTHDFVAADSVRTVSALHNALALDHKPAPMAS